MHIRQMTLDDYNPMFDLWTRTPGMGLNDYDDTRERVGVYLRRNPTTCFVAEQDGALVGVILSGHDGRRGFIYHMAVAVAAQGQGIGKRLLAEAVQALRQEGISKVALLAYQSNEKGNAFWNHQGFPARDDIMYHEHQLRPFQIIRPKG